MTINTNNIRFADFARFVNTLIHGEEVSTMKAVINPTTDGKYNLAYNGGALIKTYSRARDARRGAERMGLSVIAN